MIRQHDAPGADADSLRGGRDARDQNSGGGAGDPRHVVVLGLETPRLPPSLPQRFSPSNAGLALGVVRQARFDLAAGAAVLRHQERELEDRPLAPSAQQRLTFA
jgi:hypothetical protein